MGFRDSVRVECFRRVFELRILGGLMASGCFRSTFSGL